MGRGGDAVKFRLLKQSSQKDIRVLGAPATARSPLVLVLGPGEGHAAPHHGDGHRVPHPAQPRGGCVGPWGGGVLGATGSLWGCVKTKTA